MKKLFFLLPAFLLNIQLLTGKAHQGDSLALVALYDSTNGPSWFNSENWLQPGTTLSQWFGVYLYGNGRVYRINLSLNNLEGKLPAAFWNMDSLNYLNLHTNNLSGSIPESIGNFDVLEYILLEDNNFSGPLPEALGNVSNLVALHIYENNFSGTLPAEITSLQHLESVHLSVNAFHSPFPSGIADMPVLNSFNIDNNYFNFADLEQFIDNPPLTFGYYPQGQIPVYPGQVNYATGEAMVIDITASTKYVSAAPGNQYQWWRNGVSLTSYSSSPVLTLPELTEASEGYYYCTMTNSNWPELELTTDSIRLVIDGPTEITLTNNDIYEDQCGLDTPVGDIIVTDPDQPFGHNVFLAEGNGINDADNDLFFCDGVCLYINVDCNFETKNQYFVNLRAVDDDLQTLDVPLVIHVLDVSDGPEIALSETDIDENCSEGTVVGTITVTDPNQENGHLLTLTDGHSSEEADNYKFTIEGDELKIMVSPDYETQPEFNITLMAVDEENQHGAFHFVIHVNDLADGDGLNMITGNDFKVFPNPVSECLNIEYSVGNETEIAIQMVDMQGRTCYLSNIRRIPGDYRETMRLKESLSPGSYLLYIQSEEKISVFNLLLKN